jgi:hypothetical protein
VRGQSGFLMKKSAAEVRPEERQNTGFQVDHECPSAMRVMKQGGMGAVYKARQKDLDRVVALKILPPGIGKDPASAERFTREAKALAKLNHPGVVTLYEFGKADGLFFFLMEFVDGVSLRRLLDGERISAREALATVRADLLPGWRPCSPTLRPDGFFYPTAFPSCNETSLATPQYPGYYHGVVALTVTHGLQSICLKVAS